MKVLAISLSSKVDARLLPSTLIAMDLACAMSSMSSTDTNARPVSRRLDDADRLMELYWIPSPNSEPPCTNEAETRFEPSTMKTMLCGTPMLLGDPYVVSKDRKSTRLNSSH